MRTISKKNRLRTPLLKIFCTVLGFCLTTGFAHARIKYGLWEITVKVVMDGTPVDTPQETFQKCITRKNLTPGDSKDKEGCENDKVTRDGDTVNWTVSCERDKHTMTGNGVVVYTNNSMSGNAQFQAGGKGMATMKMKLQYKGKYLGRCK
jgi:hypothetical protein